MDSLADSPLFLQGVEGSPIAFRHRENVTRTEYNRMPIAGQIADCRPVCRAAAQAGCRLKEI